MLTALRGVAFASVTGSIACNVVAGLDGLEYDLREGSGGATATGTAAGTGGSGGATATTAGPGSGGTAGAGGDSPCDGQTLCDEQCVDTSVDPSHCGGCGMPCAPPLACIGGVCAADSCAEILQAGVGTISQPYWIATPTGPKKLYCDLELDGGGWTLVGQVSGKHDMLATWLRSDVNPAALETPEIEDGSYSCIDAVELAVTLATEVRLSSSDATERIWWTMHPGRTTAGWWNHAAGQSTIAAAPDSTAEVSSSWNASKSCYQSEYGVLPWSTHGGSYPMTTADAAGHTFKQDLCMAVGVMVTGTTGDGFSQNGNGFDGPADDDDWPNASITGSPRISVWLR